MGVGTDWSGWDGHELGEFHSVVPTSTASTTNMAKSSTNTTIITTIGSSGARLPNPNNNNNNNPTNNPAIPNSNNARFFNIYEYLAGANAVVFEGSGGPTGSY